MNTATLLQRVKLVSCYVSSGCIGTITADSGYVISPGFLASLEYPNFQECTWRVTSESGTALNMVFRDPFDLERDVDMLTVSRSYGYHKSTMMLTVCPHLLKKTRVVDTQMHRLFLFSSMTVTATRRRRSTRSPEASCRLLPVSSPPVDRSSSSL